MHAMAGTGRVISGRYRLQDPIGRGAMGTVWRAWDELLNREVAVKELRIKDGLPPEERSKAYERTHREARTAARLSHPGVVTVFDVAEEDGRPWIVMELVQARSLDQIISREGPLPPQRAAEVGRQLLAALATAHAAGVLHRDVKPSNVLLAEGGRAVLTDFGIATFEGDPGLTQTGMVMGSPGFTAPERIQGNPATPASDLWSLGATLYAAVEGHGPFDRAGGAITTMSAIINEDPPSAPSAAALSPVIGALLRRNPAERPGATTAARMLGATRPDPGRYAFAGLAEAGMAAGQDGHAGPPPPRRAEARAPGAVAAPGASDAPGAPGGQAVLGAPTSVDLPAQADGTIPVQSQRLPTPAEFFAEPTGPGPPSGTVPPSSPPSPPSPPSLPSTPARPAPPRATASAARAISRATARLPRRRALLSLGVLALVVAVAAAVMGLRAYRHPSGLHTTGQVAVESPVAAASAPPSTGPLPAGYQLDKLAGWAAGANAGYTVAVPVTWTAVSKADSTHFYAPGVHTYLEIDLTPHTYADMVTEARTLANQTQQQGHFPGYQEIAIRPVNLRGMNAASWEFTWQEPGVGQIHVLDLMYIASTPAGRQSYALYMTAPERAWSRSLAAFDEEMRTFRPAP